MTQNSKKLILSVLLVFVSVFSIFYFLFSIFWVSAFTGPQQGGGTGSGAIGVNSSNKLSVGTSTPQSDTKFLIVASSTDTVGWAMRILQPGSAPLIVVRNDGRIGITGAVTSTATYGITLASSTYITGSLFVGLDGITFPDDTIQTTAAGSATIPAQNVTAGVFGAGNFAFPSSLGIGTSTQVGLPATFTVYATSSLLGNVGIGTADPTSILHLLGASAKLIVQSTNGNGQAFVQAINGTDTRFGSANNVPVEFYVNNGEKMRITTAGNLGIGTTVPSSTLHVVGSIQQTDVTNSFLAADANGKIIATSTPSGGGSGVGWSGSTGYVYLSTSTDSVGMGTTTPATKLAIDSNSNSQALRIYGADENLEVADIYVQSGGQLTLDTRAGGDNAAFLDIKGEDDSFGLILRDSAGVTGAYANFYMNDAATDYLNIVTGAANSTVGLVVQTGGNVGIATTTPNSRFLVYDSGESTTQTNFTQALTNAGIQISTDYTANAFTPGIFWSTQDNQNTKPKAGIYLKETGSGTNIFFGTSNNYATGITNDAMVINHLGNVAIGTSTPNVRLGQKLDVAASAAYGGMSLSTWSTTAAQGNLLDFNRSKSADIGTQSVVASADFLGAAIFRGSDGTAFINSASVEGYVDGTPGTNDMPGRLTFKTTPDGSATLSERMRIDSAGRIGIATTTTTGALFTIEGGTDNLNPVFIRNNNATYAALVIHNEATNGYGIYDDVSDKHYLIGSVGIGTATTTYGRLVSTIGSTTAAPVALSQTSVGGLGNLRYLQMTFATQNINADQYRDSIQQRVNDGSGNNWLEFFMHQTADAAGTLGTRLALSIGGSGLVGVGTLASASATHLCYDTTSIAITTAMNTFASCSSSRRYKEDIRHLETSKDKLFQLQPVDFKWKNRDERGVGLIAEDVAPIFPEMVFYKNGLVEGVNYDQLSVRLLDVVRNMDSDIKSLRAENSAIQLKIKALEGK